MSRCEYCGYYWKEEDERFPSCHYEGPDSWAPCEQDEYEEDGSDD